MEGSEEELVIKNNMKSGQLRSEHLLLADTLTPRLRLPYTLIVIFRLAVLIYIVALYITFFVLLKEIGLTSILTQLGHWALILYFILLILLIVFRIDKETSMSFGWFYGTVLVLLVLSSITYWSVMHQVWDYEISHAYNLDIALHTVPMVLGIVDFIISRIYIRFGQTTFCFLTFALLFCGQNILSRFVFDLDVYPMFVWTDILTYVYYLIGILIGLLLLFITVYLQRFKFNSLGLVETVQNDHFFDTSVEDDAGQYEGAKKELII